MPALLTNLAQMFSSTVVPCYVVATCPNTAAARIDSICTSSMVACRSLPQQHRYLARAQLQLLAALPLCLRLVGMVISAAILIALLIVRSRDLLILLLVQRWRSNFALLLALGLRILELNIVVCSLWKWFLPPRYLLSSSKKPLGGKISMSLSIKSSDTSSHIDSSSRRNADSEIV